MPNFIGDFEILHVALIITGRIIKNEQRLCNVALVIKVS